MKERTGGRELERVIPSELGRRKLGEKDVQPGQKPTKLILAFRQMRK